LPRAPISAVGAIPNLWRKAVLKCAELEKPASSAAMVRLLPASAERIAAPIASNSR